jgi:hypothetical protein
MPIDYIDLHSDSAIILMTENTYYCWCGIQASQVVINRCIEKTKTEGNQSFELKIVNEGDEPEIFKAYFHGFDSREAT